MRHVIEVADWYSDDEQCPRKGFAGRTNVEEYVRVLARERIRELAA